MGHYQELPKLVHPDFAVPNRKPIGPVEIDDSLALSLNPAAPVIYPARLVGAWMLGQSSKNLVKDGIDTGIITYNSASGGNVATFGAAAPGPSIVCTQSSGQCFNFENDYYSAVAAGKGAITVSALVRFPLVGSLAGIVGDDVFYWNGTSLVFHGATITLDPSGLTGPHRVTAVAYRNVEVEGTRFFLDGILVGTTTSNLYTGKVIIRGFGNVNITLDRARGTELYDMFVWDGICLSDEAVFRHAQSPYLTTLKPAIPLPYFIPSAGGGAQEAAFLSALSQSAVFAAVSIKGAGITQAVNLDAQFAGDAASNAAVSAGLQSGYSAGSEISIEADLSFALQPAMSVTANAAASSDILAAIQAGVLFAAIAQTEATITLASTVGSSMTAQVSAGGDVEASIGVNAVAGAQLSAEAQTSADLTATSNVGAQVDAQSSVESNIAGGSVVDAQATADVSHEATVSFALQLSTTKTAEAIANASITLDASLATTILAQAAAEAGIAVGQVVNVVFDATTIAGDIITPDGRTYRISAESRIFVVPYENRTFTIH